MQFTIDMNPFAARGFVRKYGTSSKTHSTIAAQIAAQLPIEVKVGDRVRMASSNWVTGTLVATATLSDGREMGVVECRTNNGKTTLKNIPLSNLRLAGPSIDAASNRQLKLGA